MYRLRSLLAGIVVAVAISPLTSTAALNTCGVAGPWFDGVQNFPASGDYSIRGAKASIDIQDAALCNTNNTTSTWAMLNSTDLTGWAQIGYFNRNNGGQTPIYFWQWMKDNSVPSPRWDTEVFGTPQTGTDRNFKVERLGVDGVIHLYLAGNEPCVGSDCAETPFDPLSAWDGIAGEWYGETQWGGSDVPGTSTNKVNFDTVQVKDTSGSWSAQQWTGSGSDKCFYRLELVNNSSHFRIWTQPLDHSC